MRFVISRASDQFRDCKLPNPLVRPCPNAWWDESYQDWLFDAETLDEICRLFREKGIRIIIGEWKDAELRHLTIDDITT